MKKYLIISILLAMAIVAALGLTNNVVCTRYTLASKKITDSLKLVVIADFQGCEYGEHNEPILKLVSDEKPDIVSKRNIVMPDMLLHRHAGHRSGICWIAGRSPQ